MFLLTGRGAVESHHNRAVYDHNILLSTVISKIVPRSMILGKVSFDEFLVMWMSSLIARFLEKILDLFTNRDYLTLLFCSAISKNNRPHVVTPISLVPREGYLKVGSFQGFRLKPSGLRTAEKP